MPQWGAVCVFESCARCALCPALVRLCVAFLLMPFDRPPEEKSGPELPVWAYFLIGLFCIFPSRDKARASHPR